MQLHSIYAAWPNFAALAAVIAQELELLASNNLSKLKELAAHYLHQLNFSAATDMAMSALAIAPNDDQICHLLFQITLQESEDQQALKWGQRMIILTKDRASYYQQLAQLYHQLGQTDEAYTFLEQAVNVALSSGELLFNVIKLRISSIFANCFYG